MKFIFTSDLHGNTSLYRELKMLIDNSGDIDYLFLGGDLFAHTRELQDQINFIDSYLKDFLKEICIKTFFIPGNIDWPGAIHLINKLPNEYGIREIQSNGMPVENNMILAGYPFVPPGPLHRKDFELRDMKTDKHTPITNSYITDKTGDKTYIQPEYFNKKPSIEEDLQHIHPQCKILITHTPPLCEYLDLCYANKHIGSRAIRNKILELKPNLSLHGHVHESPYLTGKWYEKIGNTISINVGSDQKQLHAVIGKINKEGNILALTHSVYGNLPIDI
ncbi:metallophosphoesterase family protein [Marinifilum flexuosum]|uniref:metallophosphoesterase family protein n=1 Tax=Marinifilum flexuosum TaxID=1117708 RepID=UPI0024916EAF|nr:metallophosphoesterase [Marinifilum flexuosum]